MSPTIPHPAALELFPSVVALALIAIGAAGILLQRWPQLSRENARRKREDLELEHQARMNELEFRERVAHFENDENRAHGSPIGEAGDRMAAAGSTASLFDPVDEAVADLQMRFAFLDIGLDDDAALTRFLPVSVYVASNDAREFYRLHDAVVRLLETFDFEVSSETQVRRGSFFQGLTAKLRSPATKAELKRQAQLAHLALQQETLGKAQAEINAQQAKAAAEVHKILDAHDDYVIVVGSLVGVTHLDDDGHRSSMIVELTPDELIRFQRAGHAVDDAAGAFQMLSALRPEEVLRPQTQTLKGLQTGTPPGLPRADE